MEFITSSLSYLPIALEATGFKVDVDALADAGINTLLGMGTAFAVLILISLIISLFPMIGKIGKKQPAPAPAKPAAPEVVEEEDLSDDEELVAVIAAAIAAYEGSTSASGDGFVVRSIRKRRSGARA
ncbi:sodium pump decarboxylases, gamma subunit [Butyrivibrio fibrisolvens DSM 3071]|uniref:Sodium pump decarboxylases, gamma subunit n=1 Tax=Butyrivibrio fibrisolvens DSM 3071 TaxID=1121131 RepID=A0A1M5ZIR8_BUTFI|nr:OadG family transporter subunit [Butyrivibrio fibrisolvens]SHI24048.1 sodium pump decarboxylases, gamma subunit [Butyrivibrio fibrisolvens DSM 3071]